MVKEMIAMAKLWIGAAFWYLSCRRIGLESTRISAEMLVKP